MKRPVFAHDVHHTRVLCHYPGNVQKVKIFFTCNQTVIKGTPRVSQEVDGLELTIETALACHPQPVDCVVTDNQGREYDLSPLARVESNWAAVDTKHHDLKYYISVCRPLKPVTGATCHGKCLVLHQCVSALEASYWGDMPR